MLLDSLCPVMTTILCFIVYGNTVNFYAIIGIIITLSGIIIVVNNKNDKDSLE